MARVKANLRRTIDEIIPQQKDEILRYADLEIDINRYK